MTEHYSNLRAANKARNTEWTHGEEIQDFTWRGAELAGEIGEALEVLAEINEHGVTVERVNRLGEELADGAICVDLALGMVDGPVWAYGGPISPIVDGPETLILMAVYSAQVCNALKKMERERRGWPGSRAGIAAVIFPAAKLMILLEGTARLYGLNLQDEVEAKFNGTSIKVGLDTRLRYPRPDANKDIYADMAKDIYAGAASDVVRG